jgi:hypothetical protein
LQSPSTALPKIQPDDAWSAHNRIAVTVQHAPVGLHPAQFDLVLDNVAAAIDTDSQPIGVVVFRGEMREFALQRHRKLRPDHAGRLVRFEYRNEERDGVREMFAVHTREELWAVLDRIEVKGGGKPIGEQMWTDAHGRGDERDRPNHSD